MSIKVTERFPNFVCPGDNYIFFEEEFESVSEVFCCKLVKNWKSKLGNDFKRIAINSYMDPTGVWIDGEYMLTIYDKNDNVYNIAWIK